MKKTTLLVVLLYSISFFGQQDYSPIKNTQKGFIALDFLSTKMPDDILTGNPEANMGLTGIHYNFWLTDKIYGGVGFYGAVTGKRGGLFTLGMNFGAKINLAEKLFLDSGFHFGAGGGASAPDGGGAFILPHLNLEYQLKSFSTLIGVNYINFFDKGNIRGFQLTAGIQIPISFDYTDFNKNEKNYSFNDLAYSTWNQKATRMSLMMHLNNLTPTGSTHFTNYTSLIGKTIRLAGFEINSYITNNWFGFFKVDGAYHGIRGGYMDIIFGAGYHYSFNKNRTNILGKFGLGAGGGGGADTGGGFLLYPDISIEQKLFNGIYLSINKGFLRSADKTFTSSTLGFGLKYYIYKQGIKTDAKNLGYFKIKGLEVILAEDMYLSAKRMLQPTENLYQFSFQANVYLNKYFYLAGKTSFANFGNAGAYAEGIVGIGFKSNSFSNNKLHLFVQGLGGAAGGGDISTGQGLIFKPSGGLYYKINNTINIRTALGFVKAKGGSLSSPYLSIGLSYNIGVLVGE